jgi:hypothetical protein
VGSSLAPAPDAARQLVREAVGAEREACAAKTAADHFKSQGEGRYCTALDYCNCLDEIAARIRGRNTW